jgi:hypothetical protein
MSRKECMICGEKENKVTHSMVGCNSCEFEACRKCYVEYFKSEGVCRCMEKGKCGVEWSRSHLVKVMTKSFMTKEYKELQEKRMMDTERALLPATMDLVREEIESEKREKEIQEIDKEIRMLMQRKENLLIEHRNGGSYIGGSRGSSVYVRSCPEENCRGYLNGNWKCDLCEKYTCKDCNVVLGKEIDLDHVCEEGAKATAALLKNDTRPCPKCGEGIFKIDGCDQMWCTKCHTAFSWKTGIIEKRIHNPHYYEWMRQTHGSMPRDPQDVQGGVGCIEVEGELEDMHMRALLRRPNDILRTLRNGSCARGNSFDSSVPEMWRRETERKLTEEAAEISDAMTMAVQGVSHIRHELGRFRVENGGDLNVKTRVAYLREKITEEEFKSKLFRTQKDAEKKREITDALNLYMTASVDILRRGYTHLMNVRRPATGGPDQSREVILTKENAIGYLNDMKGIVNELVALELYVNNTLKNVGETYGVKAKVMRVLTNAKNEKWIRGGGGYAYMT